MIGSHLLQHLHNQYEIQRECTSPVASVKDQYTVFESTDRDSTEFSRSVVFSTDGDTEPTNTEESLEDATTTQPTEEETESSGDGSRQEATEVARSDDDLDGDNVACDKPVIRKFTRTTAGKHSNPHIPRSVLQQGIASVTDNEPSFAELS